MQTKTPAFVARRGLSGGHRQTLASFFLSRRIALPPAEARLIEVEPGVQVRVHCHWQSDRQSALTVIIVHGLEGSSDSSYMNSPGGILETAKCDTWSSTEINPEEEIFGAAYKFGSYVDILFSQEASRCSFAEHEQFAKRITQLLKRVPEIPAAAELLVRRCFYHVGGETCEGFYITLYLFGYGDDEAQARQRWAIALKLVENAIRQVLLM